MKLTPLQIQYLKISKANKDKPLKIKDIVNNNKKKYCLLFICLGTLFTLSLFLDPSNITSSVIFGLFIGMLSRDLGMFRMSIHLNPITLAITDWSKVDKLLKGNEQNQVSSSNSQL